MTRNSIFFKIFLWFWLAVILLVTVFIILDRVTVSEKNSRFISSMSGVLEVYGGLAADFYERGENDRCLDLINRLKQSVKIDAYLLNSRGEPVLPGLRPPDEIMEMGRQSSIGNERRLRLQGMKAIIAMPVMLRDRYVFVGDFQRGFLGRWANDERPVILLSRLLGILGISGAVCYALSIYFIRPIVELSAATKRFAKGDVSARVGSGLIRRNDELAELGEDFNIMAAIIGNLMSLQRQLVGDISHELRSPLARINLAVEMAKPHVTQDGEKYVQRIEKEAGVLNGMIGELLALSEMESGIKTLSPEKIDLSEMVGLIVSDADFEARSAEKSVVLGECARCVVVGNESLLHSAVENVLRNAVRYTKPGTQVVVSLRDVSREGARCAEISVQDCGDGVPEEELTDIFRPFYRTSNARDRKSGGVGLGLHIAERALKLHNGDVKAENVPGSGMKVTMRLPLNGGDA